jgi:flagellar basal-body rod protein FlgF
MDPLTSAAASGMRSSMESLDLLANNLANAQTNGYKTDREFFDLYTSEDATDDPVQMPNIVQNWTDYSQGTLLQTANALDFGISGDGFFSVSGPSGTLYTRNGAFKTSPTGRLTTQDGYPVLGANNSPIQLDATQPVTVSAQGAVMQGGAVVAQLQLSSFNTPSQLVKQGANYFLYGGDPNDIGRSTGAVYQGKLEGSNVAPAEATVRLVSVMRQFEMLQKAISIGTDMNHEALEEVARIGQ